MKKTRLRKFRIHLKSKHLLVLMTLLIGSAALTILASGISTAPLQEGASLVIVPFEKSLERIGSFFTAIHDRLRTVQELLLENEELRAELDSLTNENNKLILDREEYARLKAMYELDKEYSEFPKVAARIIAKDPGNWYDTFMINRGSRDGIRVNNNVIAGKGLIGIVTEVGDSWATVRTIIDDSSSVSAMTVSTQDNFIVHGDLELIDEGKLKFEQLYDVDGAVTAGERVVTSNISENYVEGLFIGYINEVVQDSNNLTKTGTIVSPIDFAHLKNVLVITINKQDDSIPVTAPLAGENSQTDQGNAASGSYPEDSDNEGGEYDEAEYYEEDYEDYYDEDYYYEEDYY
ncbi:MAG: rod shape-determining protein MreC [Blautia sp.]|nr:rod shape-determining protein MreC [Blautia sp.]